MPESVPECDRNVYPLGLGSKNLLPFLIQARQIREVMGIPARFLPVPHKTTTLSVIREGAEAEGREAVQNLDRQGRVHEVLDRRERIAAIATEDAREKSIDAHADRLTVELQSGTECTYDPRRQQGVSVFREETRSSPRVIDPIHHVPQRSQSCKPGAGHHRENPR